jgi:glycosyltransferase involved in cell wall biosynthesis
MNVAVNLLQYFHGRIGGIENYVRHVVGGLARHQEARGHDLRIFVLESEADNVRRFAPGAGIVALRQQTASRQLEEQLASGRTQLLFCPLLVLEPLRPNTSSAVMIPDLQHEYYPEFFSPQILAWRKQNYGPSARNADVIFTISEHSRQTIIEKLGVPGEKIVAMGLDVDDEFRQAPAPEAVAAFGALELPARYIYYPANFWPHKNHQNLLRALRLLIEEGHRDLHLVLTGAQHGASEVRKQIAALGLRGSVRLLGYQDRPVVVELHRHACALAFISKFEGFGIPILEAFHAGAPVVCSSSCSCPEVAGDAAVLVDEHSPEAIAEGLDRVVRDARLRNELIAKGRQRASMYNWAQTVESTIAALTRVACRPGSNPITVDSHPLVSVTTPSYNMARFLEETIGSVLSQDYPHIEYIVMDGGSTDGTLEILKKYAGRLRYESGPDKGQAEAINKGFAASKGEVFAYLNADDCYLPGAVGKAVSHLMRNPHAGMVYGDAYYTDESGKILGAYPTHTPDMVYLNRNCYVCQPAAFLRRYAFEDAGWMNVDQHYVLDYDLWMRLVRLYPMVKIDEYLAMSRMYRDNKTLGKRRQVYEEILGAVRTHFGYVPFDWTFGYACYLIDRKDQFFDATAPSRTKYLISLLLGLYYNPRQARRFWNEWASAAGLKARHEERWSDGWISKRFRREYDVGDECTGVRIAGKHWGAFPKPLNLTISLDGTVIGRMRLDKHGDFCVDLACPAAARGKRCALEIHADRTFRPVQNGDYRDLSCVIDEITFNRVP